MALGLHNASERVRVNDSSGCGHLPGKLVPLEKFDYLNDRMGCVLRNSFQQVSFRGITVSHPSCSIGISPVVPNITDRDQLYLTAMEAGMPGSSVFSSIMWQVSSSLFIYKNFELYLNFSNGNHF